MQKASLIGNREKALIHVAKAQLGMSEEAYRDLLATVGVASSKDLDQSGFDVLMAKLEAAGFVKTHKSAKKSGMHKKASWEKQPMISKIGAVLADLGLPWSYADGMARRMFGVERLKWCDSQQTYKIVQALAVHQRREKAKLQAK